MNDFTSPAAGRAVDTLPATANGYAPVGIEEGYGVDPIELLIHQLSETEEDWAKGAALFGAGGFANDVRKKILSVVMLRIRDALLNSGDKAPTEKVLDAMAHADKQYTQWLDRQVVARAEWLRLDAQRDAIEMRCNRGQALLRVAGRFA